MSQLLSCLLLILSYAYYGDAQSCPCRQPTTGGIGQCINLQDCEPLYNLLLKKDRTAADVKLLKDSQCGYANGKVQVCCPRPVPDPSDLRCFTPDGKEGTCIPLKSCSSLVRLLSNRTPEITRFIQNSRCESTDPYSVCCNAEGPIAPPQPGGLCKSSAAPPDPRTECCGLDASSGNKIFGGNVTAIDQFPWLAIIEYKQLRNCETLLMCGAVLISGKYVLTAGHCVVGPVLNQGIPDGVRVGEYDITKSGKDCVEVEGGGEDCTDGAMFFPIEHIIPHAGYDPTSQLRRHDIALLRLKGLVPYTDFIRPICLPTLDITASDNMFTVYTAGWGAVSEFQSKSNVKLFVDLPHVNKQNCQPSYNVSNRKVALWEGQLCAGGEEGKDSCKGDSGGPLMYDNGRLYDVVGIVSFGPTPCGIVNVPGVYTKVHAYMPWIRTHIKP